MSVFKRFHPQLQRGIVSRLGWSSLRPVQELSAEAILDGKNAVVLAPTAGGKTEASFFPCLSHILEIQKSGVKCIYLSPIKALLNNQEERIGEYATMLGLTRFKWHGDTKKSAKNKFIKDPTDILMITPESLEVILVSGSIDCKAMFENLSFVIIDEVHNLADNDRGNHMLSVLERYRYYTANDFQRIGLSATVGNPKEILHWLTGSSQREGVVIDPPNKPAKRQIEVKFTDNYAELVSERALGKKSLFFCDSRRKVEEVAKSLQNRNINVYVHHSSVSREERLAAEQAMNTGKNICIVCTSTLELGIDVGELDNIFQYDCPSSVSAFMQRMGRTGRRPGSISNTTFFTMDNEPLLQSIAIVELARQHWVEPVKSNDRSWHLLVHQLMVMCLQHGAISRFDAWNRINNANCFSGINTEEYHKVVNHMIESDLLMEESGLLSMGLEAEGQFGRFNFMEMYSVFSSTLTFSVKTVGGQELGTIEGDFAKSISEGDSFILSGKAWTLNRIEYENKIFWVTASSAGKLPKWSCQSSYALTYNLCRMIHDVLTADTEYSYCDGEAQDQLNIIREDFGFLYDSFAPIHIEEKNVYWWTHAGWRVNNTLKEIFKLLLGADVTINNFYLKMVISDIPPAAVHKVIKQMKTAEFWDDPELQKGILEQLPEHRLSKFQDCLPGWAQFELIGHELLDVDGTKAFLVNM